MANNVSLFDVKKVRDAAEKASGRAVADATAYLWTVAKNSVKKNKGREKKTDLDIFAFNSANGEFEKVAPAKKYLKHKDRQNEQIVQRDTKRDVRDLKTQGRYLEKKASAAGQPPKSHRTLTPGWRDYWLREGIRFDPKAGVVYVNPTRTKAKPGQSPHSAMRSKAMPQLIEMGGRATSHIKALKGYFVKKKYYKNGKIKVSYTPIYRRKIKQYQMQPRPFLVPALHKAAEKLIKILKGSIGK